MYLQKALGNLKMHIIKLFSYTEGATYYQRETNNVFLNGAP